MNSPSQQNHLDDDLTPRKCMEKMPKNIALYSKYIRNARPN